MKKQSGFTLIEILIAMALLAGTALLVVNLAADFTGATLRFSGQLITQQAIQQTIEVMMPEIRSASQSNTGNYPIGIAASTTFQFYSDIDADGLFERVRYFISGSTFHKGIIKPTGNPLTYSTSSEIVLDLIYNMITGNQIFTYYDENATSTQSTPLPFPVDVLRIKMVKVALVANQGTTSTPAIVGVENQATIRNTRYD